MKSKLSKITAVMLILQILPETAFSYEEAKGSAIRVAGPVTVALVPISPSPSEGLRRLVEGLAARLEKTKGIRVQKRAQTNELLGYYRSHVVSTAKTTGQDGGLAASKERIREVRYDEAARLLDSVERSLHGSAGNDLAQVYILKAKIFHSRNRDKDVQAQFEKLVRINPAFELDSSLYGKWALKGLKQAKASVSFAGVGSIAITSSPTASEVFVNGFHRGITPLTINDLPHGRHVVEIRTVHHKPVSREIQVKTGETIPIKETLEREQVASKTHKFVSLDPRDYRNEEEFSRMITTLGYHLGVDKVILVSDDGNTKFAYRFGDTHLGAVQNLHELAGQGSVQDPLVASIAKAINSEARTDILKNPGRFADQTVGNVALLEKRKKPFYKRPLFWILVGASAGTGGALAAILGGGAAAAGAGGILIGL